MNNILPSGVVYHEKFDLKVRQKIGNQCKLGNIYFNAKAAMTIVLMCYAMYTGVNIQAFIFKT